MDFYYSPVVPQPLTWSPRTTAGLGNHSPNRGNWYPSWRSSKAVLTAACWQTCLIMFLIHRDPSGLPYQLSLKVTKPPILPGVFLRRITNRLHAVKMWEACPHACPATYKEETLQTWGWHTVITDYPFSHISFPARSQLVSPALPPALLPNCPRHLKFVGRSFQLNVLGLKKFNFRVVLTAMLGDFYFKRRKKKKKKLSNKMFTLEVRASWFPEGRSLHQLVAAPKQIPSRELTPVPLLCSAGNDCEF